MAQFNVINKSPFLRTSIEFPEEQGKLVLQLNKTYVDLANAINSRTISIFPTTRPAITGESWFINNNKRQQTIRQVYSFGAISSGTELDIPTNISGNIYGFTRIYGTVSLANGTDFRPLPYVDPSVLTTSMTILVGLVGGIQQIRIVLGATAPPVASGIAVLEWLSEP